MSYPSYGAAIRQLEDREEELRGWIIKHPDDRVGNDHEAVITSHCRHHLDREALAAVVGVEVVERCTEVRRVTFVKTKPRDGNQT